MRRKLGDHIKEYKQRNKSLHCTNVYSVTNSEGFIPSEEYFKKQVFSKDISNYKLVKKGMIAYNPSRINVGSIANLECDEDVVISPLYIVFETDDYIDSKFLTYFLKSKLGEQQIRSLTSGSVRDSLKYSALERIIIPDITIIQQRELVKQLETVEKIISLKERKLEELDTIVKSRFVEMFGDPIINDKHFESKIGEEVYKLSNGKTVHKDKRLCNGIPAYGGNGISWYTDEILYNHDTVVVGRVGFQSGNVHLVKGPLWITDNAMYISEILDAEYKLEFIFTLMKHIDFTRFQDAGDLKKVTQKPFMQMKYIKPSLLLQEEYLDFAKHVDILKAKVEKSLDETHLLFDSLMQKYFD